MKASLATTDDGQQITVEALPMWIRSRLEGEGTDVLEGPEPLLNVQREHVQHALNYYGGDRERTARELGIERRALDELLV